MAKKVKQQKDEAIGLDVQLTKSEQFIEKNWKILAGVLVGIILIVLGGWWWTTHKSGNETKAQNAISAAQTAFAMQQYEQALNGDGANAGFKKIIKDYSGTKTANLAKLYAAVCYAQTGKTDDAIKMFEDYEDKGDETVSPAATAALGNCYIQKGNKEKGVELLLKAAKQADNEALSPVFLLQAGQVYEDMNQKDKALELYNQIKKDYFRSPVSQNIDAYIERASK